MDLTPSDEQRLLAETAAAFVARECPVDRVRGLDADPVGFDLQLWQQIAALGWSGLLIPEEHGGAGQGLSELTVVCEALGRGCVPSPLEASGVLAARALTLAGDGDQRRRWLPRLASGEAIGTLALLEPGRADEWAPLAMPGGRVLSGTKMLVPWAGVADVLVVATADGPYLLETAGNGVVCQRHHVLGGDPLYSVELRGARAEPLGDPDCGRDVLLRLVDQAAVARLAQVVGVAEGALDLTVAHARDRHQFGRPIGSFQAVAHRCVDMRVDLDACRFLTQQAAWALDRGGPAELEVGAAKAYANEAIRRIFLHAHQVHGAIGFSTESPLHLYTRRAKAFELTWGATARHHERIAGAMGLECT